MPAFALVLAALMSDPPPSNATYSPIGDLLRTRYGIEQVMFRDAEGHEAEVLTHLIEADRELGRICTRYPRIAELLRVNPIGTYLITYRHTVPYDGEEVTGSYWYAERFMEVCVRRDGADAIRTLRHELGHHLHEDLVEKQSWRDFFARKGKDWWKEKVTGYSARNDQEAFAESFVVFTDPSYTPGRLPTYLERWLQTAIEPAPARGDLVARRGDAAAEHAAKAPVPHTRSGTR